MSTTFKIGKAVLAPFYLLLVLLGQTTSGFRIPPSADCGCASPTVTKTSQSSASVSFSWYTLEGANGYRIWYTREEDSFTSQVYTTGSTTIGFSDLPAGTYRFYFSTACGGCNSQIVTDDLMMN